MLDAALNKLSQFTEQLIEKNTLVEQKNEQLQTQYDDLQQTLNSLKEENESLQLEALEQEEKQTAVIDKVNELLTRLQPAQ
ncbi:MAG: DUF904 domain-containing protein [Thalassotalea sp.]|nr:DUF904 domain-containing protein [Thalassotalea sp.]MDG2393437.1 DUF904 domain-containing protein [Thalassotalea sp.]